MLPRSSAAASPRASRRRYYPSQDRTAGALAAKYGYAMGRDALTNVFREFWPDIATHVLHRHPWLSRMAGVRSRNAAHKASSIRAATECALWAALLSLTTLRESR